MRYLALFFTTTGSMKFKKKLKNMGKEVEVMPVPRELSSSCGVAVKFSDDQDISYLIDKSIEKIYTENEKGYFLLYNAL